METLQKHKYLKKNDWLELFLYIILWVVPVGFFALLSFESNRVFFGAGTFVLVVTNITFALRTFLENRFLRVLLIFEVIHLLIFPVMYAVLQNSDPQNFLIDKKIFQKEYDASKTRLHDSYDDFNLRAVNHVFKQLLSRFPSLDKTRFQRVVASPLIIDTLVISTQLDGGELPQRMILISTQKGDIIGKVSKSFNSIADTSSLSFVFKTFINENDIRLKDYDIAMSQVLKSRFWNYESIFPYALNIFNTDNIKAQSIFANVFLAFHQIIFIILTAWLCNASYEVFKSS
ncbi:hypothetical protein [Mucilaginibacter ginkgonis]|uniref:Uncharacterized protein n=1 Tax=Mucilaginibacter ginkgonis TaxID=2682091 RepID=A0A6I4I767_9SPHI|nr:hypothetical protein [Mucilaginibacter ginkgonis]QQL49196.1 hypothetical protein GO620_013565 [Mucilaginibacter ginkgonis]